MRHLLLLMLVSTALATPAAAQAEGEMLLDGDEGAQLDAAARVMFERGSAAYAEGRFDDALSLFSTAYELSERPALLYNIAVCHDRMEHKQEALAHYERFTQAVPESPRAEVANSRANILREALAETSGPTQEPPSDGENSAHDVLTEPEAVPSSSASLAGPIVAFVIAGAGPSPWRWREDSR